MGLLNEGECSQDQATRRLYDEVAAGTAFIKADNGRASGFLVRNGDEVVTNAHVVEGTKHVTVTTADGTFPAQIERLDDINDLALLKIIGPKPVKAKPLELGRSDTLQAADKLFAVGHPLGRENIWVSPGYYDGRNSLALAELDRFEDHSSYNRTINSLGEMFSVALKATDPGLKADANAFVNSPRIESTMHTEHGNSGSPVVDDQGKVVSVDADGLPSDFIPSDGKRVEMRRAASIPVEKVKDLLTGPDPKFEFIYKTENTLANYPKLESASNYFQKNGIPAQWAFAPFEETRSYLAEVKRKNGDPRKPLAWLGWDHP